MASFLDLGALWRAKEGQKSVASGTLDVEALETILGECRDQKNVRIFLQKPKNSTSSRGPDYRVVAVYGQDEERRPRRDWDEERPPRRHRDGQEEPRLRRGGEGKSEKPIRPPLVDVNYDDEVPF